MQSNCITSIISQLNVQTNLYLATAGHGAFLYSFFTTNEMCIFMQKWADYDAIVFFLLFVITKY